MVMVNDGWISWSLDKLGYCVGGHYFERLACIHAGGQSHYTTQTLAIATRLELFEVAHDRVAPDTVAFRKKVERLESARSSNSANLNSNTRIYAANERKIYAEWWSTSRLNPPSCPRFATAQRDTAQDCSSVSEGWSSTGFGAKTDEMSATNDGLASTDYA